MKSVLITGGTGFFGQGMVRRLLEGDTERICIYSRDEVKQANMRAATPDPDERLRYFIGDVRDLQRLRQAMNGVDLVIHAAALNRIETGHYNPEELIKTNIGGAMNVVDAASSAGVQKVVALSTDKAYQPISPYGQSKALAESLFLNANNTRGKDGPRFACARYGNIWGSTGSVVPTWKAALANREPLRVTDPNCTRFYMTLDQALNLVLKTAQTMEGGEMAIPDLPAYRLQDLIAALVGAGNVAVTQTVGLPRWEKLHESMSENRSSETARRMSVYELKESLERI